MLLVLALWPKGAPGAEGERATGARPWGAILKAVPWFAVGFRGGHGSAFRRPCARGLEAQPAGVRQLAARLRDAGDWPAHPHRHLLRAGRKPLVLAGLLFVFLVVGGALLCAVVA
ncbi:hypothetical protein ACU4GD_02585 [Cupriavidus basilensis]